MKNAWFCFFFFYFLFFGLVVKDLFTPKLIDDHLPLMNPDSMATAIKQFSSWTSTNPLSEAKQVNNIISWISFLEGRVFFIIIIIPCCPQFIPEEALSLTSEAMTYEGRKECYSIISQSVCESASLISIYVLGFTSCTWKKCKGLGQGEKYI